MYTFVEQIRYKMTNYITETRTRIAEYVAVGFTASEAFAAIRDAKHIRTKRSGHKLAEIIGNNEKRTYSIMDKSFKYH